MLKPTEPVSAEASLENQYPCLMLPPSYHLGRMNYLDCRKASYSSKFFVPSCASTRVLCFTLKAMQHFSLSGYRVWIICIFFESFLLLTLLLQCNDDESLELSVKTFLLTNLLSLICVAMETIFVGKQYINIHIIDKRKTHLFHQNYF